MEYRIYGKSEVKVSAIGLGAGDLGSSELSDTQAYAILDAAYDHGITLFDTARSYGLSEERLGRWSRDKRSRIVLSTKVGYGIVGVPDWTFAAVSRGIDEALHRLQTDVLDIVHLHSCGLDTLRHGDVIAALLQARNAGKIRCAAYSGENEALQYALHSGAFDGIQCSVNILDQHNEKNVIPSTATQTLGVLAKRTLANGVWRFTTEPQREDHREYWRRMQLLDPEKQLNDRLAFRYAVFTEGITSALIGTSQSSRISQWLTYWQEGPLPPEERALWQSRYINANHGWTGLI